MMVTTENKLRKVIRDILKEIGDTSSTFRTMKYVPSGTDKRLSVSSLPSSSFQGDSVSQSDAVKLMSISIGFFQSLINDIRFKMLSRDQVNKICKSLVDASQNKFNSITVVHPYLRVWKEDVLPLLNKIDDESSFKKDFFESIISNCEMIDRNFSQAFGKFPQVKL